LRAVAQRLEGSGRPMTLVILAALSIVIGVMAGSRATFGLKTFFYVVVLANVLIAAHLLVLKNMAYGILIYFYSLTYLNYYWRIVVPGKWPDIDIPRLVFVFIWVIFLLEVAVGGRRLLPRTRIEPAMLAMLAAILISMNTIGQVFIRQMLNGFAIPYAMFLIGKNVFTDRESLRKFLLWLAVPLSIYFPVNHMFEHYRITQLVFPRFILSPEIAGREVFWGERTMGVFLQPSATGTAMISMFLLSLYSLSRLRGLLPKIAAWFITCLTPIAVFFSYTRSLYLGYFVAMMTLLLFSRRLKIFALIIVVGVMLGVLGNWANVTTEERGSGGLATKVTAVGRLTLLQASIAMFMDRPLFGVGFQNFRLYAQPYVAQVRTTILGYREPWIAHNVSQHNHFLNILTETGLMGFIPLVLVWFFMLRTVGRARTIRSDIYDSDFVVVVWAVIAQYLMSSMFMEPRWFEFMNVLPFFLGGIVVGGYQRATLPGLTNNIIGERSVPREGPVR
jgi:O-antigen ligase